MGNYESFYQTVKGYSHKKNGIPCEDYSWAYTDMPDPIYAGSCESYSIAAVADGHGDQTCIRSKDGSRLAVQAAKECLMDFADRFRRLEEEKGRTAQIRSGKLSVSEKLSFGRSRYQYEILRRLTDTIVIRWDSLIRKDLYLHPFEEEELKRSERYEEFYRSGKRMEHAYGTTLICALLLPQYLILIQQGDGRCDVFYEDGTVDQPIPWDDSCYENITTSMCDMDAADRIRSCVIPFAGKKVIACCLGSDGVEDSFRNMEGTHNFYRKLLYEWVDATGKPTSEGFKTRMEAVLEELSRQGSGDDISVAVIADRAGIQKYAETFRQQAGQYELQEELKYYQDRKISMTRKYEHLLANKQKAERELSFSMEQDEIQKSRYEGMKKYVPTFLGYLNKIFTLLDAGKGNVHGQPGKSASQELDNDQEIFRIDLENIHQKWKKAILDRKKNADIAKKAGEQAYEIYQKAVQDFQEYDEQFQHVCGEIQRIEQELQELDGWQMRNELQVPENWQKSLD